MAKSDNGELNNSNLASNNSDPNNSLLQKVTKRVSGLFPSSITKWFGPSDGSTSVIRRRDTEDDDEQLQIQQPPKKRAKSTITTAEVEFSTTSNHFQMTSTPLLNSRHLQPGPSGYTRHTIPTISTVLYDAGDAPSTSTSTSISGRNEATLNGDDKSDSGESTNRTRAIGQPSTSKDPSTPSPNKSQNTSRSLFSDQSLNPQRQCLSARRPSFNSSTFGSPTFVDRTLSTKRAVNSPFYGGRTIYGGASAYKRNRIIFPRDEANNLQIKNSVNIKPVDDATSNENVSLSKTARRILNTLEHFSTPVIDAKKIPNINRQPLNKTQRLNPYARETPAKHSAPNRELIIPTVPDLLKMKQKERLQNSTEQVRKLATTSKSILNSEYSIRTLDDEFTKPQKHTTKIKAKIATVRDKKKELRDTVDAVQLPDIKLPITNLPKFDFTLAPPSQSPKQKTAPEVAEKPNLHPRFKFANPVIVNCDKPALKSINHFKFSEPIDAKHPPNTETFKGGQSSTAPRKKDQKNNGQNSIEFVVRPPEKLIDGSVMDILGKPDSLMDKFKPAAGTWECASCMVRNTPTATRCVACDTPNKPKTSPEKQFKTSTDNQFKMSPINQFKMSPDKWECNSCLVRNNITEVKCVACTTPKPGTSAAPKPKPTPIPSGFGDKFKPASDTWECGACMIRNKNESVKCAACETPKPGSVKRNTETVAVAVPAVAAPVPSTGFTDLIKKQQTNWECPSCMVRNPPEKKTCACCEGPKPGEKQEFTFTQLQFKFGIDKSGTSAAAGSGFNFGGTPAATFSFGVNAGDSKPTGFTFGVPPKTESQTIATAATTVSTVPTIPTIPISTAPSFSFGIPTETTTSNVVLNGDPKKMFSFGTQSTTITSSTNSLTKSTTVFNPVTATTSATTTKIVAISSTPSDSNSMVSSTSTTSITTTATATTTTASSTTFSFGTPKSTSTPPQFNFGSGGGGGGSGSGSDLPFNPVFGSASNITTKTTTTNFAQPTVSKHLETNLPGFNATASFPFKSTTNNNKPEMKPFSFATTSQPPKPEAPKGKFPEFSFNPPTSNTPTTKTPVGNFDATAKPSNSLFNFGAKTETKTPSFGGGSMFGQQPQQQQQQQPQQPQQNIQTPQNGGFNFGATAVTPNFNFGGATASSTTPTIFGFGSSQAGSGSATAASAPGVFTFGGQQPTTAAFTPDVKPNFNFSGGAPIGTFTGQGGPSATMPQRKIRKAVRRTQPR